MGHGAQHEAAEHLYTSPSMQLPPLSQGSDRHASSKEVTFRRLLHSTEQQLACLQQELAADPQAQSRFLLTAAKLRHFLASLEDQLGDLERLQGSIGLSPDKLALYRAHVKQLSARVPAPKLPRYCQPPVRKVNMLASLSATSLGAVARPDVGQPGAQGGDAGGQQGPGAASKGPMVLSGQARQHMKEHQQLQDELTDELLGMAAAVKDSAMGIQAAVQRRGELVDTTEAILDKNVHGTQQLVKASAQQLKRGRSGFCFTCMVLLLVGLVFTAMLVYIKFTYFIGYRGAPSGKSNRSWVSTILSLLPRRRPVDDEL